MMDGLPESSQKAGDIGVSAGQYNLCCVSPLSFYATQGSLLSPGDTQRYVSAQESTPVFPT
ncbi:hypothetical protein [Thiolapillus sp.]|uniref:hypothetical protein n=1 Tax=Thiolapillus sp. TaxID=2017437 RepID=UPI003AF9DD08